MSNSRCPYITNSITSFFTHIKQTLSSQGVDLIPSSFGIFSTVKKDRTHQLTQRIQKAKNPSVKPTGKLYSTTSTQEEICQHLYTVAKKNINSLDDASLVMFHSKTRCDFIICNEIKPTFASNSRYFKLYFSDLEERLPIRTPFAVCNEGILEVTDQGELSLFNRFFQERDYNVIPSFNNGFFEIEDILDFENEQHATCKIQ